MATTARLDLSVWRNDDVYEFPLRVIGPDLTGVSMLAQIRLLGDTPGPPLANLSTVTNAAAEGVRLAGVSYLDGKRVNDVRIRINKSTRQALPYAGEVGTATELSWGLAIAGITRIEGAILLPAQVIGSDSAPANRAFGYSLRQAPAPSAGATLTIANDNIAELVIDGADLLGPMVADASDNADRAEAAAMLVAQRLIVLPPTDDGLLAIEYSTAGRIQRGQYLDGRFYDPSRIVMLPPTDDGVLPIAAAYVGSGFRIIQGQRLDGGDESATAAMEMVFPTDARLTYAGFPSVAEKSALRFRGRRTMYDDGKHWQWHCPGGRVGFYTAGSAVRFDVAFRGSIDGTIITSEAGRTFRASVLVDGAWAGDITGTIGAVNGMEAASGTFALPSGTHRVDLVWPYDKAMDLTAIRVGAGGGVAPVAVPARRLVAGGDSITHGFNATRTIAGWAWQVAASCGLELMDMGYGGRVCDPLDGTTAGAQQGYVGTYLIGFNDCADAVSNTARTPTFFQNAVQQYVANWFAANTVAGSHLILITPIYTTQFTAAGEGSGYTYGIQRYRDAMTAAYNAVKDQYAGRLHLVSGLSLMTNGTTRLSDGVHPNDTGAAEIAAALTPTIQALL